jgi:hypothetical protein
MSSSGNSKIIGSFDPVMITADEIAISRYGGEAWVDYEVDDPLNKDVEDDIVDVTPSIEQYSTQSSSL